MGIEDKIRFSLGNKDIGSEDIIDGNSQTFTSKNQ